MHIVFYILILKKLYTNNFNISELTIIPLIFVIIFFSRSFFNKLNWFGQRINILDFSIWWLWLTIFVEFHNFFSSFQRGVGLGGKRLQKVTANSSRVNSLAPLDYLISRLSNIPTYLVLLLSIRTSH